MLKSQENSYPDSTWNKAKPDEPLFIIRATDKFAAKTIRDWAARVASDPEATNGEKVLDALKAADQVDAWQTVHGSKVPD